MAFATVSLAHKHKLFYTTLKQYLENNPAKTYSLSPPHIFQAIKISLVGNSVSLTSAAQKHIFIFY